MVESHEGDGNSIGLAMTTVRQRLDGTARPDPTQRSRRRFSLRATGLPWNLTFADAAEQVRDGESGHSQVAVTDLSEVPAERLHPKAAYSRCRPKAAVDFGREQSPAFLSRRVNA